MKDNSDLVLDWLSRAESSLVKAKISQRSKKVMNEDICFDAQQTVEKALKAVLVFYKIEIPKTHSINKITALLNQICLYMPESIRDITILSEYAVETRYPGDYEPVTNEETKSAISLAEKTLEWTKDIILKRSIF